jgi:hypothetical protein
MDLGKDLVLSSLIVALEMARLKAVAVVEVTRR